MRFSRLRARSLLTMALLAHSAFAGTVIERTMAFVNKRPVLLSDVELTRTLLKLDEAEAVERTIDEFLMFDEASRLITQSPAEEVVVRGRQDLQAKAGPGFSLAALRRKALVQLAIANYIDLRLRPQVRVEDAEVRRVFNERVVKDPEPPPFNLVADAIRESLEQRSLDQKIEEWVASLRRREEVRRVTPKP